jgi:hypothetical protein
MRSRTPSCSSSLIPIFADRRRARGRPDGWPRRQACRIVTLLATGSGSLLLTAAPAAAHGYDLTPVTVSWPAVALRCTVLVTTAVTAGIALLHTGGNASPTLLRGCRATAVIGAAGALAGASVTGSSMTLAAAQSALLVACAATLGRGHFARVTAAVLVLAVAFEATVGHPLTQVVAGVIHTTAAAIWFGAAAHVAFSAAGERASTARHLRLPAVVSAVAVTLTGVLQAHGDGLRLQLSTWDNALGKLVAVKIVLLTGTAVLGLVLYSRRSALRLARVEVALLAATVILGGSLAAASGPPPAATRGMPQLRQVSVAGIPLDVLVTPQRPGWNVVHVAEDVDLDVRLDGGRPIRTTTRLGASGRWAALRLPAGHSTLVVRSTSGSASLPLDTGTARDVAHYEFAGPDAPECANVALGILAAGPPERLTTCPASSLSPSDVNTLGALPGYLARRGARRVAILADTSARGRAAAEVMRTALSERSITATTTTADADAAIIVAGWQGAEEQLRRLSGKLLPRDGVYLAPWLLDSTLLTEATTINPLLLLGVDPGGDESFRYLAALRRLSPAAAPTASGFEAWAARTGIRTENAPRIFASALVSIMPPSLGHVHATGGWLDSGTITPVSVVLPTGSRPPPAEPGRAGAAR